MREEEKNEKHYQNLRRNKRLANFQQRIENEWTEKQKKKEKRKNEWTKQEIKKKVNKKLKKKTFFW